MNLPKLSALMTILAMQMPSKVLKDLLATSTFTVKEKEDIKSNIGFLLLLKRKVGKNEVFFRELNRMFSICCCQDLLTMVTDFNETNRDWLSEKSDHFRPAGFPESIRAGIKPHENQVACFRKALFEISQAIRSKELEIMIGVSPIPESTKEGISTGYELFEMMERHGCINEDDTELLQELLELLRLSKLLKLLHEYRIKFPQGMCKCTDSSWQDESYSGQIQHFSPSVNTIGQSSSPPPFSSYGDRQTSSFFIQSIAKWVGDALWYPVHCASERLGRKRPRNVDLDSDSRDEIAESPPPLKLSRTS